MFVVGAGSRNRRYRSIDVTVLSHDKRPAFGLIGAQPVDRRPQFTLCRLDLIGGDGEAGVVSALVLYSR